MYNQQPHPQKSHLRFYIFMSALVLGGIFLLLFLNDESKNSLTSFTVKELTDGVLKENKTETTEEIKEQSSEEKIEKVFTEEIKKNPKEVSVALSFDRIPFVRKEAKIKEMRIIFEDLTTKIKVNNDKLELSNLEEVTLLVNGFEGEIDFNEKAISLNGIAKSITVNDFTLSTKEEIKVAFEDLTYRSFVIEEIELMDLEIDNGEGELKVEEKMTYALEQDEIKMYYFNGMISVDKGTEESLQLEGVARGVSISGALLNLNLR